MSRGVYMLPIASMGSPAGTNPFVQIAAPADRGVEILGIRLGQEASETSQQEAISLARRSTASTMAAGATPLALSQNDAAYSVAGSTTTMGTGDATVVGTLVSTVERWCFNVLNGLLWLPPDWGRVVVKPGGFATLQFITAPASLTWSGGVYIRDLE